MAFNDILAQIDAEIARLQQAKSLLAASQAPIAPPVRRGRPPLNSGESANSAKKKRKLSPEGRARIAEAVKRRWALQKAKQKSKA
jgi:hypothetical protein